MEIAKRVILALVIIGAVNWGLIGLFQFDLVATLFGGQAAGLSRVVYTLVGISGVLSLGALFEPMEDGEERFTHENNVSYGTEFSEDIDITDEDRDKLE